MAASSWAPAIRWRSRCSWLPVMGLTPVVRPVDMGVVVVEVGVVGLDGQRPQQQLAADVPVGVGDRLGSGVDAGGELTQVGGDVVERARHDAVDPAVLLAHRLRRAGRCRTGPRPARPPGGRAR